MAKKSLRAVLALLVAAVMLLTGVMAASAEADQAGAEEGKTLPTALEQFVADWGESYAGTMGTKDYTLDFEAIEAGTDFSTVEDWEGVWLINNATADYITAIEGNDSNHYLQFRPFGQMYLEEGLTDKYVFSYDVKQPANQGFGAFFRSSGEVSINPYFEDDASGLGIFGIGPSGIYLIPNEKIVRIYIKTYDEKKSADKNGKYVNNKSVSLKCSVDFTKEFNRISIADYGTGAKVFVNGELLCTLEFSDRVDGYEELLSEYGYYSKVTVFDSEGNQKTEVNNALVCADMSVLAFGMRINEGYIDNVTISEYQEAIAGMALDGTAKTEYIVGEPFSAGTLGIVTTFESGKTKKVAVTEDMLEGFDTSAAGSKTVKIKYGEEEFELAITVSEAPAPTEAATAAVSTDAANATAESGSNSSEEGEKNNKPLFIGLGIAGVLLIAIAVIAIVLGNKKKKAANK